MKKQIIKSSPSDYSEAFLLYIEQYCQYQKKKKPILSFSYSEIKHENINPSHSDAIIF